MNGDLGLIASFAQLNPLESVDVVIFPPTALLTAAQSSLKVSIGAQNCFRAVEGAFTGETSPRLLASLAVQWVLLGHSERRKLFGEADESILAKTEVALEEKLNVVLCVGETLEERESSQMESVLKRQLSILSQLAGANPESLVIAYEPVWAIGTGKVASPAQAQSAHQFIRDCLKEFGLEQCRIIYGGSVTAGSATELAAMSEVDGFLVGGASLKPEEFSKIILAGKKA